MKCSVSKSVYYVVSDRKNGMRLDGTFNDEEECLKAINQDFQNVRNAGYDGTRNVWILIATEVESIRKHNGDFLKKTITEYVTNTAEYSETEDAFVFTY